MAKIVIKPYEYLPCSLEVFTINGKKANPNDFGEGDTYGDPGLNSCGHRFRPKMPSQEVLDKYYIDLEEYKEITEALESELYVGQCGLCW